MTILVIFCQVFSFYSFFLPLFLLTVDSTVRSSLKFSHYVRDREFKILNASLFELTFSLINATSFISIPSADISAIFDAISDFNFYLYVSLEQIQFRRQSPESHLSV